VVFSLVDPRSLAIASRVIRPPCGRALMLLLCAASRILNALAAKQQSLPKWPYLHFLTRTAYGICATFFPARGSASWRIRTAA